MENQKIYSAINGIMSEIGAIGKTKKNSTQGFMFRGVDDVMNTINPALQKYKVCIVPEVLEHDRQERVSSKGGVLIYSILKMQYTFVAEDGSSVKVIVMGEGMDSGDKSMNKAMSIAFKYACFQLFCIPTEEMKDPDAESHELSPNQPLQELTTEPIKEELITKVQDDEILKLLAETQSDVLKDISNFHKTNLGQLTKKEADQYIAILKKRISSKQVQ